MPAGKLLPPYDRRTESRIVAVQRVVGPTSYPSGGFSVMFEDISYLSNFTVKVIANPSQLLEADNTVYSISWSVSGNMVTIVVKTIDVTGAAPVSWTELPAGTDLSGVEFIIEVFEE